MRLHSSPHNAGEVSPASLADAAYVRIKQDIFDFRLSPGERFSETFMAEKLGMSRTPVRDALSRLQNEGFLEVHFRSGWSVKPLNFEQFDHLYDLRMVLETTAVRRLCEKVEGEGKDQGSKRFEGLKAFWLVPKSERLKDEKVMADMDEQFHLALVAAAGNPEMARVHRDVTERISIIRRLDFTKPNRIEDTYNEHAQILRAIIARRSDQAIMLLRSHIEASKAEVHMITLHRLYMARR